MNGRQRDALEAVRRALASVEDVIESHATVAIATRTAVLAILAESLADQFQPRTRARKVAKAPPACPVCDGERIVTLGTGAITAFTDCPHCVGIKRGTLCGTYENDAVRACLERAVDVKWLEP